MQVTGKLKPVEKDLYKKAVFPQITSLPFFSKKIHMAIKQRKIAAQIIFIGRQINLNTWSFKIIAYNQENYKKKKKKKNMVRYFLGSVYFNCLYKSILDHRRQKRLAPKRTLVVRGNRNAIFS